MRAHYFQHVPFEGPGNIEDWLVAGGHDISYTRFYEPHTLPELACIDWLIVMGGPMGAQDESLYPWLQPEKKFIAAAIKKGVKVLGICLGAQLIASVLGARVYPHVHKEIGWYPLRLTPEGLTCPLFAGFPEELFVFHWHGDTFDLPAGAIHLAESAACHHQAFLWSNHVLALQFHMDLKKENVEALVENCNAELVQAPHIQKAPEMLAQDKLFATSSDYMNRVLRALEAAR
jgi:GMP synthase (glutamine-hydrolysing)